MKENKYFLSICIPTYNRADALQNCLDSIVYNELAASGVIEIVVCDNASTDETQILMQKYTELEYVKYYRNEENIGVIYNTIKVIDVATGEFRKLLNDYSVFSKDSLEILYNQVVSNQVDRPILLFDNKEERTPVEFVCNNIDEIVHILGYWLTWMGVYGYWKEDWQNIRDKTRCYDKTFTTIDYLFQMLKENKETKIYRFLYTDRSTYKRQQGGYNFFKVFVQDYLDLWHEYYEEHYIMPTLYKYVKKNIWPFIFGYAKRFLFHRNIGDFEIDDGWNILLRYYGNEWYFWWSLISSPFYYLLKRTRINVR